MPQIIFCNHCHQLLEYSTMRAPHKLNSAVKKKTFLWFIQIILTICSTLIICIFCDDQDCQSQAHRHRDSQHQLQLLHLSPRHHLVFLDRGSFVNGEHVEWGDIGREEAWRNYSFTLPSVPLTKKWWWWTLILMEDRDNMWCCWLTTLVR